MCESGRSQSQIYRLVFLQLLINLAQLSSDQRIMLVDDDRQARFAERLGKVNSMHPILKIPLEDFFFPRKRIGPRTQLI